MAAATGPDAQLDTQLDAALGLVIGQMRGIWHRRMRSFDLTPPQSITLRKLLDGPLPMGSVAEVLSCDASTLTGIADRLEERRVLVQRGDHEPGPARARVPNDLDDPEADAQRQQHELGVRQRFTGLAKT